MKSFGPYLDFGTPPGVVQEFFRFTLDPPRAFSASYLVGQAVVQEKRDRKNS